MQLTQLAHIAGERTGDLEFGESGELSTAMGWLWAGRGRAMSERVDCGGDIGLNCRCASAPADLVLLRAVSQYLPSLPSIPNTTCG